MGLGYMVGHVGANDGGRVMVMDLSSNPSIHFVVDSCSIFSSLWILR